MADLYPAPARNLFMRLREELQTQGTLFDLPENKFWTGDPNLDTSVKFKGDTASTPLGPAAGPQSQLAQNIVLSWLGGGRIMELKTVQINDKLELPRPCIWAGNVGYNVEWSQELTLQESLREYVTASMLIDMLNAGAFFELPADWSKGQSIFDISVGYDLEGIRSGPIVDWISSMKDATRIVDSIRAEIPDSLASFRDHPFKTALTSSVTLSTFHGCPAGEIERIVEFLLVEMGLDVFIKMNPTLLGSEALHGLVRDKLGYDDIRIVESSFAGDLKFPEAIDVVKRLRDVAGRNGRVLGVKFTNTLVIENPADWFPGSEAVMYLSGPPLHVMAMNILKNFREEIGPELPISFSAGIDARNFHKAVAMNLTPITVCTDLLKTGGYGRLKSYLQNLEEQMRALGVRCISDYVVKAAGKEREIIRAGIDELRLKFPGDQLQRHIEVLQQDLESNAASSSVSLEEVVSSHSMALVGSASAKLRDDLEGFHSRLRVLAGGINTPLLVDETTEDPRYHAQKNSRVPRKLGSKLYLYDCISCDKCVPVCPNNANFVYDVRPREVDAITLSITQGNIEMSPPRKFHVRKPSQFANFSDFCNECGNCDVFCPEDGGPYIVKPRFFGSVEAFERHGHLDGFLVSGDGSTLRMRGRIEGAEYQLERTSGGGITFENEVIRARIDEVSDSVIDSTIKLPDCKQGNLDLTCFHIMRAILEGVMDAGRINYVNVHLPDLRGPWTSNTTESSTNQV